MSVFVDDMHRVKMGEFKTKSGRVYKMSHMIADTEEELHAMARIIGVARRWYQRDHYDVTMTKRQQAIDAGAVPITMRELGRKVIEQRKAKANEST